MIHPSPPTSSDVTGWPRQSFTCVDEGSSRTGYFPNDEDADNDLNCGLQWWRWKLWEWGGWRLDVTLLLILICHQKSIVSSSLQSPHSPSFSSHQSLHSHFAAHSLPLLQLCPLWLVSALCDTFAHRSPRLWVPGWTQGCLHGRSRWWCDDDLVWVLLAMVTPVGNARSCNATDDDEMMRMIMTRWPIPHPILSFSIISGLYVAHESWVHVVPCGFSWGFDTGQVVVALC